MLNYGDQDPIEYIRTDAPESMQLTTNCDYSLQLQPAASPGGGGRWAFPTHPLTGLALLAF